jgi:acetylornithine/N-succinyldiaminopimelate aminotransferase
MHTYAQSPVSFVRGQGARLWDSDGKEYLDAISGIAVCALGHCHPAVTEALCEQAGTLVHTSNLFGITLQQQLAEHLCRLSRMDSAFFCNSGAEAVEAAIKLARLYGHGRKIRNPAIIVVEGSFHGRTMATLSATGNRKVHAGFEPLVQGFRRVPYDNLEAIQQVAQHANDVVAVLVEPILGEGGIVIPRPDYLNRVRALCNEHNWLLLLDEVQTGLCRTGKWFAHQHNGIEPDVMSLAKPLGNGLPIGACLARGGPAEVFQPGNHGSTFGGSPLACRAALAVLEAMESEGLADRAANLGQRMLISLGEALSHIAGVKQVRGQGLMLAVELDRPCGKLVTAALERGLVINVTVENVVRLLPPLIITEEQADQISHTISELIKEFLGSA